MLKSWKTTLGGSLAATGTFLWGVPVALAAMKVNVPDLTFTICVVTGIAMSAAGTFFSGLFGRDNDVPSSAVPRAAERDSAIKGDSKPPFPTP